MLDEASDKCDRSGDRSSDKLDWASDKLDRLLDKLNRSPTSKFKECGSDMEERSQKMQDNMGVEEDEVQNGKMPAQSTFMEGGERSFSQFIHEQQMDEVVLSQLEQGMNNMNDLLNRAMCSLSKESGEAGGRGVDREMESLRDSNILENMRESELDFPGRNRSNSSGFSGFESIYNRELDDLRYIRERDDLRNILESMQAMVQQSRESIERCSRLIHSETEQTRYDVNNSSESINVQEEKRDTVSELPIIPLSCLSNMRVRMKRYNSPSFPKRK